MADERTLEFDDFSIRIGEPFRLRLDDGQERTLSLIKATAKDDPNSVDTPPGQFSVVFHDAAGSVQVLLPQGTYRLENSTLGAIDVFIVPIGAGDDGVGIEYEAVFNRMGV